MADLLFDLASESGWTEIRMLLAGLTALLVVWALGPRYIRFVRSKQLLEAQDKGDSRQLDLLHAHKAATPTLGGALILAGVLASTLSWARLDDRGVLLLVAVSVAFAGLGFIDDSSKLRSRRKGISARTKLACQVGIAGAAGLLVWAAPASAETAASGTSASVGLFLPFWKSHVIPLGVAGSVVLAVLVVTATSNAVNLTDGLDGLAAGLGVLASSALSVYALVSAREDWSAALRLPHVEGGAEVAVFLSALTGAGLGFLWFNGHPAQIFMGDTGSLFLGGSLGLSAVICRQEVTLLVIGGVFAAEALSVILQVGSFKLRRKRVFLIAPLHHHFQFKGWSETKVTIRFWIVGAVLALAALFLLGIP